MVYVTSHQKGPEEDPVHETVVLEMYMIDDKESWVQEQRGRKDSLHRWVLRPRDEPHPRPPSASAQNLCPNTNSL